MEPHTHVSAVHVTAGVLGVIVVLGTVHLVCLTTDNRFTRAWIALGL